MNRRGAKGKAWFTRYIKSIYPLACAGDPTALSDLRAFAKKRNAAKIRNRRNAMLKSTSLLASMVLVIAVNAAEHKSLPLSDKIVHVSWRTNKIHDPNLAMRGEVPIPVTNVTSRVIVYRIGPGLPLFTNVVPVSTNVGMTKPPKKPLKSPKDK